MTATGFPDWQPGSVALHGATPIQSGTFTLNVIPSTQQKATANIWQTGYELYVACQNAAPSGNISCLTVQMDWTDSQSQLLLARRKFKIIPGPNGTDHTVKIAGPVHADTVRITFGITADSVHNITVNYQLLGTSRPYTRDIMRSTIFAQDGFTASGVLPEYGVLVNAAPTVGAGLIQTRILPAYNGRVHVVGFTSSGAADYQLNILEASNSGPVLINTATVANILSGTNGFIETFIELPNLQCVAQLNNQNAASKILNLLIDVEELGT